MSNFYTDNEDLQYYFRHGVDWKALVWSFDLEEGVLDTARLTRIITDPTAPLSFQPWGSPARRTSLAPEM